MERKKYRIIEVNNLLKNFEFSEHEVQQMFYKLDEFGKYPVVSGTLSICFLDSESMRKIHKNFLSDDTLTDVITFPGSKEFGLAGEICVSPNYAIEAIKAHGTTFSEELTLYLIHGYLHLSGLNDIQEQDIINMRQGERECMDMLKAINFIPKFTLKK